MEVDELSLMAKEFCVKTLSFDYSGLEIEFENGVTVTIEKCADGYGGTEWHIDSSIDEALREQEREKEKSKNDQRRKEIDEINKHKQNRINALLSKLNADERRELYDIITGV